MGGHASVGHHNTPSERLRIVRNPWGGETLTPGSTSALPVETYFRILHRDAAGIVCIFAGTRAGDDLIEIDERFYHWPTGAIAAAGFVAKEAGDGHEVYACPHRLSDRKRRKPFAIEIDVLWVDLDHDRWPDSAPCPAMVVESSPGRWQVYVRLSRAIEPAEAEGLNRRLGRMAGGDASGWDLTQLLRIPGTRNHKYPDGPPVRLIRTSHAAYDPAALDRFLPSLPPLPLRSRRCPPSDEEHECSDVPPVELDQAGFATWRGERPKLKADGSGEVDRSASLLKIGRVLRDAGATRPTIERALAERDVALDWRKYSGRGDDGKQYAAIVDLLERDDAAPRATIPSGRRLTTGDAAGGTVSRIAELEAELAQARSETEQARRKISLIVSTMTNPHIKAEAVTAFRLIADIAHRRAKGERPDGDGFFRVSPAVVGDDHDPWGHTPAALPIRGRGTVNRHLKNLDRLGLIERRLRPDVAEMVVRDRATKRPVLDPETNVPRRQRVRIETSWVKVAGETLEDMLAPFARYRRPAPSNDEAPTRHGGKREKGKQQPGCPHCGGADVACRDCGAQLGPPGVRASATASQDGTVRDDPTPPPPVGGATAFHLETRSAETDPSVPWPSAWIAGDALPTRAATERDDP